MSKRWAWLFDIGSTFTKLTVVDLDDPRRICSSQAPTTVSSDVRDGFMAAVHDVEKRGGPKFSEAEFRAASSSAAGGLALIVSGLVPRLSAEAGRMAALGAGAKLVGFASYRLTDADIEKLAAQRPDIVLLTGGTDGGDRQTLLANAAALATWRGCPRVIVAGNREAAPEAARLLSEAGIAVTVTPNILPELDRLEVEPVRDAIRHEFLSNIVHAKGIDRVANDLDAEILPTPAVVLEAVRKLAETEFTDGVMVMEVGGATTNVHSFAPTVIQSGVIARGLPEPDLKRTVEGDLGVRWNAHTILEMAGLSWFVGRGVGDAGNLAAYVERVVEQPSILPETAAERDYDRLLATFAGATGIRRHCGRHRERMLPEGPVLVQEGKDLRKVAVVIGTGGSLIQAVDPGSILAAATASPDPFELLPKHPRLLIDSRYALYAVGLLAGPHPDASVALARHSLVQPTVVGS